MVNIKNKSINKTRFLTSFIDWMNGIGTKKVDKAEFTLEKAGYESHVDLYRAYFNDKSVCQMSVIAADPDMISAAGHRLIKVLNKHKVQFMYTYISFFQLGILINYPKYGESAACAVDLFTGDFICLLSAEKGNWKKLEKILTKQHKTNDFKVVKFENE